MREQIQFIMLGADVRRYHTVRTLVTETVGHHSHGVAALCLLLVRQPSANLLRAALLHDLAEHQTGDIPSPAKRQYGIGDQVSALENQLLDAVGLTMPLLTDAEERTLKLADIAQGALFCAQETHLGNEAMWAVYRRYMGYAESMILVGQERELFEAIKDIALGD